MNSNLNQELENILEIETVKKAKYLGLTLSAKCSKIKKDNHDVVIQKISVDLDKWSKLQISLLGKIAVIKMNVLPKILYLFQTAPIRLNKEFFDKLDKIIHKFIWAKKKARIKLKHLQDHKSRGGMGLPNWKLYYIASALVWIKDWIQLKNRRILILEGFNLEFGWHSFLFGTKNKSYIQFKQHYIRKNLLEIWFQIKRQFYIKIPRWFSPNESTTYPNLLNPNTIMTYHQILTEDNQLISMQILKEKGITLDWMQYFQINSKYTEDQKHGFQKMNKLDKILLGADQKLISKLYKVLLYDEMCEEEVKGNMIAWAKNIGNTIYLAEWEKIWNINYKLTISSAYKENILKMFYRWHLPPDRLAKMFPNTSPKCWKCKVKIGTYYHLWWTCTQAKNFWKKIKKYLEQITTQIIPMNPELFLLGIIRYKTTKEDRYLTIHIITAARLVYAQHWKLEKTPSTLNLISKINEVAEMNKLTLKLRNKEDTIFYRTWDKWYEWLEAKKYLEP